MRKLLSILVVAVLVFGLAAASEAARNPTKAEKEKIAQALKGKFDCSMVGGSCHRKIKVSTKQQTWAAAYISGSAVQGDVASLHRKHHRWHVHQIGNGGGCGVPEDVAGDLKLACY
jgi:hypothetical protein